jgi:hypothetical protein
MVMILEQISGMNEWQGKPKYSEKTSASAALSTTEPTQIDPGSNSGRCGWKPATIRLSYRTAQSDFSHDPNCSGRYLVTVANLIE